MGWFRKRNKVVDERIRNTQNKIYREIHTLIMVICLLSLVVKTYMLDFGLKQIITELIIIFVASIYYTVRAARLGIFSDEVEIHDRNSKISMSSKNLYVGLGLGLLLPIFFGIRSAIIYGDGYLHSIYIFLLVLIASLMIYIPFCLIMIVMPFSAAKVASQKAAEKDLDDE